MSGELQSSHEKEINVDKKEEEDEYEDREQRRCFSGTYPRTPQETAYELRYGVYRGGFSEVPFDEDERDRHARMHWEAWSSRERPSECYKGIPGYLSGQPIPGYKHPDYFDHWEKALCRGSSRKRRSDDTYEEDDFGTRRVAALLLDDGETGRREGESVDENLGDRCTFSRPLRQHKCMADTRTNNTDERTKSTTSIVEKTSEPGVSTNSERTCQRSTESYGLEMYVPSIPPTGSPSILNRSSLTEDEHVWLRLRDELEEACHFFFPTHNTPIKEEPIERDTELANILIDTSWEKIRIDAENFANISKRSKFWIEKYHIVRRVVRKRQRDIVDGDKLSIPEGIRLSEQLFELTENDPIMVALDGVHYMIEVIIQGIRLRSLEKMRRAILRQREDQMPPIKKKRSD